MSIVMGEFLAKICYEHVKYSFYYGIFGDFKIIIDKITGYFNATKLCQQGGKNYEDWTRLDKSESMLKYYNKSQSSSLVYEVKFTKIDELDKQITGVYVPEVLILDIASWISIAFYEKCSNIILTAFTEEIKNMDNNQLKITNCQVEPTTTTNLDTTTTVGEQEKNKEFESSMVVKNNLQIQENLCSIDSSKRDRLIIIKRKTSNDAIITMLSEINIIILD